jgi:hypothetical protein
MRAAKVDANHAQIVEAFRAYGWKVHSTAALKGWCDLVCQRVKRGTVETLLVEVKTAKGKPTKLQTQLALDGWWIHTVRSVEDVAALSK